MPTASPQNNPCGFRSLVAVCIFAMDPLLNQWFRVQGLGFGFGFWGCAFQGVSPLAVEGSKKEERSRRVWLLEILQPSPTPNPSQSSILYPKPYVNPQPNPSPKKRLRLFLGGVHEPHDHRREAVLLRNIWVPSCQCPRYFHI